MYTHVYTKIAPTATAWHARFECAHTEHTSADGLSRAALYPPSRNTDTDAPGYLFAQLIYKPHKYPRCPGPTGTPTVTNSNNYTSVVISVVKKKLTIKAIFCPQHPRLRNLCKTKFKGTEEICLCIFFFFFINL